MDIDLSPLSHFIGYEGFFVQNFSHFTFQDKPFFQTLIGSDWVSANVS
jgi:hypothetical protein